MTLALLGFVAIETLIGFYKVCMHYDQLRAVVQRLEKQ